MMMFSTKMALGLVAASAIACGVGCTQGVADDELNAGEEPVGSQEQGKIIGENDLVPVSSDGANIPTKYAPLIDAFGIITMGCTATHIGNGIVVTAGHCFRATSVRQDNTPCAGVNVQWGVRVGAAPYMTSACQVVLAKEQNRDRDYAFFKVDPAPTAQVSVDFAARPSTDTTLTILGHPRRRPLEWSQTCPLQPSSAGGWGIDQFSHQCDTEPGSSGSSVLDDNSLKIIGIHDGGSPRWNYATYLYNTPIGEFIDLTTPAEPTPTPEPTPAPDSTTR